MTSPLLSIIIPVHNGEKFLAEAIQNVQQQNYQPLEVIVIDDGSTDGTAQVANQFQSSIRYIYQLQQGPSAARNHGIKLAQGDFIAFLDVDDLWADQILGELMAYLIAHPNIEIVQGLIQRKQWQQIDNKFAFQDMFAPYQCVNLGSAIFRKSVFDKVGQFDESLWRSEDTDWFVRAWEQNVAKAVLPKVMLFYRKHDCNMTRDQKNIVEFGLMKVYKRHIDRLREWNAKGISYTAPSTRLLDYLGQSPD